MSVISYVPNEHNKVSAVVDHLLFKKSIPGAFFQWCLEMGLWKLRELKLDTWQDVCTELLDVTDRNTVILPNSFVDWTKVGRLVGQYVVTLGTNSELNNLNRVGNDARVAGLLSQNLPNGIDAGSYIGYTFMNFRGTSVFGLGAGFPAKGTFKVHDNGISKELLLDYDFQCSQIYLEFITDGFNPCGETVLNPYLCDFFLKSMEAAWEEDKAPDRTEASIYRKNNERDMAERVVRARRNDLDPKTLLQLSRSETRFTPKI